MAEIILAAIDQKRGAREQAETKLSFFKTPLTYRWLTRFRSMLSSAFRYRCLTNRFHVAVRLFSNRSQMTSKCGKNKKVAHEAQPSVSLMFLPHFDVLCDLLLNRRTATWNLFVLYNKKIKIHGKNALLFQISPL